MKVLCNLNTKEIEGFSRWDDIDHDPATHIVLNVDIVPEENDKLNDTNDGVRKPTQLEIDNIDAAEKIAAIEIAIQAKLDSEAKLAGYDSIHTAVTYAGETSVSKFSDDGKSFRKWRSLVWGYCYAILADYQAGNIPEPTLEEMIAGMPARV